MPTRPPTHDARPLARHEERPSAARRGYSWKWQRARAAFLARPENVICAACRRAEATVVDHKVPHRGDGRLFWDERNWQPLCGGCHNKKTAEGQ